MTIYLVDVVDVVWHVCPANPDPHVVNSRQIVMAVTPGGACRNPITIRCGDTTAVIDCGRHEPDERQCAACRTQVTYAHTLGQTA
jgi:hypothetical protein